MVRHSIQYEKNLCIYLITINEYHHGTCSGFGQRKST